MGAAIGCRFHLPVWQDGKLGGKDFQDKPRRKVPGVAELLYLIPQFFKQTQRFIGRLDLPLRPHLARGEQEERTKCFSIEIAEKSVIAIRVGNIECPNQDRAESLLERNQLNVPGQQRVSLPRHSASPRARGRRSRFVVPVQNAIQD